MLPFNPAQFIIDYPQFATYSANQLNNLYYTEALVLGRKLLALFNNVVPSNTWNASTNTPTLANNTGQNGQSYLCTVGGSVDFGAGTITFVPYNVVVFQQLPFGWWVNMGYPAQYNYSCLILAHILTLLNKPSVVGRISDASEDPISSTFSYMDTVNSTWWNQTQYGAQCWQVIKQCGGINYYDVPYFNGFAGTGSTYNIWI